MARSERLTDTGRKLTTPQLPVRVTLQSVNDAELRPWKYEKDAVAFELLRWCVSTLDEKSIKEFWPLLIPPVLTLVDDWEVRFKIIGVELLASLLQVTPALLLTQTGLGEVFEEALLPCLTYLPTLTPPRDSVALLQQTYPALLLLANIRFSGNEQVANNNQHSTKIETDRLTTIPAGKTKSLDALLRKGIIYGYMHASDHPEVVTTLFEQLCPILDGLGINSVKHIKHILPILTETMSHPFGSASTPLLQSAALALQALMRNCWPRMVNHCVEILKSLSLCWLNSTAAKDSSPDLPLQTTLKENVELLNLLVREDCDLAAECGALVAADERLGELFKHIV